MFWERRCKTIQHARTQERGRSLHRGVPSKGELTWGHYDPEKRDFSFLKKGGAHNKGRGNKSLVREKDFRGKKKEQKQVPQKNFSSSKGGE